MNGSILLTIDQSTTGTKAILTNEEGRIVSKFATPHQQYYPQDGWVEHDPLELYHNVKTVIRGVLTQAELAPAAIAGITITNQRETALIWNRKTGLPIANAIVWQCRRTADFCDRLKADGQEALVQAKTGLLLDPYFSAAKWRWLLDHHSADHPIDELMAGTVDSWLLWKLTGGRVHATDYTNASRTQLFNIHTLHWDKELAELFGVPLSILPQVYPCDHLFGRIDEPDLFPEGVLIAGVIGDSQGALFGQQCIHPGMAKGTFGTGTSILMNVGKKPIQAAGGLVSAIAWGVGGRVEYALEAIIHSTGDSLNWARDQMGLYRTFEELEEMITAIPDTGGVYLVPAFIGLGAPHWNPRARAAFVGMNRSSDRRHLLRATVESIAYQVTDAVRLLERHTGMRLAELRVDGGATTNGTLMQLQADLLNVPVVSSEAAELSALGSAYIGGLALGVWSNEQELASFYRKRHTYIPQMDEEERSRLDNGWQAALKAVLTAEAALN
jgi:glycerol kinase